MARLVFPLLRSFLLIPPILLPRVREVKGRQDCARHVRIRKRTQLELFQWLFVFTLMTLELGLVPLPLYARNR